jgi:hypothetical protein
MPTRRISFTSALSDLLSERAVRSTHARTSTSRFSDFAGIKAGSVVDYY